MLIAENLECIVLKMKFLREVLLLLICSCSCSKAVEIKMAVLVNEHSKSEIFLGYKKNKLVMWASQKPWSLGGDSLVSKSKFVSFKLSEATIMLLETLSETVNCLLSDDENFSFTPLGADIPVFSFSEEGEEIRRFIRPTNLDSKNVIVTSFYRWHNDIVFGVFQYEEFVSDLAKLAWLGNQD